MPISAQEISNVFKTLADSSTAKHSKTFFKTGKGQYGEGDIFLGIRVPVIRKQVKKFIKISNKETLLILKSPFHEERLFAILVLVEKFLKGCKQQQEKIYDLYLSHIKYINNWDLVDSSASQIVGRYLYNKNKMHLYTMVQSTNIWTRRIAIIATLYFIKQHSFNDTLQIATLLLNDKEDLIHKAVGWMLREVGKRDINIEENFLKKHYLKMPRTMLRYSIEKFEENKRKAYLKGTI